MRTIKRSTNIIKKTYEGLGNYLSPSNFTYLWSLGSMALICLIIQILSGLFISMFYKADINMAFTSVEYINRELYYGWLVRYIHMNGASIFFLVVYMHMSKHILYGSYTYPRQVLWFSGMIIFILMMATAFMGYVLPWGQMSLWGATVITNIFSAIPVIGIDFVYWLWGGLAVENATLSRFYSLHFIFPFIILAIFIIHLVLLNKLVSKKPLGKVTKGKEKKDEKNFMIFSQTNFTKFTKFTKLNKVRKVSLRKYHTSKNNWGGSWLSNILSKTKSVKGFGGGKDPNKNTNLEKDECGGFFIYITWRKSRSFQALMKKYYHGDSDNIKISSKEEKLITHPMAFLESEKSIKIFTNDTKKVIETINADRMVETVPLNVLGNHLNGIEYLNQSTLIQIFNLINFKRNYLIYHYEKLDDLNKKLKTAHDDNNLDEFSKKARQIEYLKSTLDDINQYIKNRILNELSLDFTEFRLNLDLDESEIDDDSLMNIIYWFISCRFTERKDFNGWLSKLFDYFQKLNLKIDTNKLDLSKAKIILNPEGSNYMIFGIFKKLYKFEKKQIFENGNPYEGRDFIEEYEPISEEKSYFDYILEEIEK
jgi:hypothetical protein